MPGRILDINISSKSALDVSVASVDLISVWGVNGTVKIEM